MSIPRTILERLSRNVILSRTFPKDLGQKPLLVSPGAALAYWKPGLENIDPMLLNIVRKFIQQGQVVWDIGSNMGLFAFAAAYRVCPSGRVLAVEADSWCVNLLRRSGRLPQNQNLNVDILPVAVSNKVGIAKFNIANRGRATNFLTNVNGSSVTGGIRETISVPSVSLDWLLTEYAKPDFVKIDVEGAELLALQGAQSLLTTARPQLMCEVQESNAQTVSEILQSHGYVMYDAENLSTPTALTIATENIVAIPSEKVN